MCIRINIQPSKQILRMGFYKCKQPYFLLEETISVNDINNQNKINKIFEKFVAMLWLGRREGRRERRINTELNPIQQFSNNILEVEEKSD